MLGGVVGPHVDHALQRYHEEVAAALLAELKRVQTRTMTIYTEVKIHIKMPRNGLRMYHPRAKTT